MNNSNNLYHEAQCKIDKFNKNNQSNGCCCGFRPHPSGVTGPTGPTHTLISESK